MTTSILAFTDALLGFIVLFTCQLVLILLLRDTVARRLGTVNAYRLWLLPLLCLGIF